MLAPETAVALAWTAWALSWFAAAGWRARSLKRAGVATELPHGLTTLLGFVLLFSTHQAADGPARQVFTGSQALRLPFKPQQLWTPGVALGWGAVAVAVVGFALCWWARIHLGRLWSGVVATKSGHRVVDTGPYGLVRHPIYTGLIMAAAATAAVKGTASSLAGVPLIVLGFWLKARLEERFLAYYLGRDDYANYARHVRMLLPLPHLHRARKS